ncbi:MAG: glutamyl-tRNA reductase [Candidatus Eisenbacteria bacterium]|nr:glutamyl-tRNA reductase [Candidatus Eisenbacteria bacterium]
MSPSPGPFESSRHPGTPSREAVAREAAAAPCPPTGRAAPARGSGLGALRLRSVSHRATSPNGFERAALDPARVSELAAHLESCGIDAVVLATCNRVELYWHSRGEDDDGEADEAFRAAVGAGGEPGMVLRASGEQVASHLLRVACGLDSLMLGEAEILGQVREALEAAPKDGFMAGVFRAAVRCGGGARAETSIGAGALSVASAAVQMLARAGAPLPGLGVLVVGIGETGLKAARHLRAEGVGRLVILNRTVARAEAAAGSLRAEPGPLDALPARLAEVDAAIVAVHVPAFLLAAPDVRAAMAARGGRPLVLLDVSMPRAVDPAVREVPGVTLHDMLGFEALVHENRLRREQEIPRVEAVIARELEELRAWARDRMIRPLVADLRSRAEEIRLAELRRSAREDLGDPEAIDRLTRRLVDRLLAIPIAAVRDGGPETFEQCGLRCLHRPVLGNGNGRA